MKQIFGLCIPLFLKLKNNLYAYYPTYQLSIFPHIIPSISKYNAIYIHVIQVIVGCTMFHLISVTHKCFRHFIYVIWFLLTFLCYLLSTIPILLVWTGRNVITNKYIYYSVQNYNMVNHNSHDNCVYYNYQYSEFPKRNNPICKKNDFNF